MLFRSPTILLLDEPLSNLDAVLRKRMRLELREIQQKLGITTIFVTHDQDEAFEMSDRVVLLNKGRIEQLGSPEDMYDRPNTRFAAEFIGETNFIKGRVQKANGSSVGVEIPGGVTIDAQKGATDFGAGAEVFLMVRPERVGIRSEAPKEGVSLQAKVSKRVFSGDQIGFTLTTDTGVELVSTKPSLQEYRKLSPGDTIWVVPEDCRVLPVDG